MSTTESVQDQFIHAVSQQAGLDYDQKLAVGEKKDKFDDHKRATSYKRHLHNVVVVGMYLLGSMAFSHPSQITMVNRWATSQYRCCLIFECNYIACFQILLLLQAIR